MIRLEKKEVRNNALESKMELHLTNGNGIKAIFHCPLDEEKKVRVEVYGFLNPEKIYHFLREAERIVKRNIEFEKTQ